MLDGANIHSMMASEEAVDNLMMLLTSAIGRLDYGIVRGIKQWKVVTVLGIHRWGLVNIDYFRGKQHPDPRHTIPWPNLVKGEVEHLESRLNQYDDLLEHIRDSMEKMEGKTESLETVNENNRKLLLELDTLVTKLTISYEHQMMLQVTKNTLIQTVLSFIYIHIRN